MRKPVGCALLIFGGLSTGVAAFAWWMRATADVGEPLPVVYVLTVVGPLMAIAGGILLRSLHEVPGRADRSTLGRVRPLR